MSEVWPDEIVEEGNLAQHISLLRKALGEQPTTGKYIETVPRRGYRFFAPVELIDEYIEPVSRLIQRPSSTNKNHSNSQQSWLAVDPRLESLRSDRRFAELVAPVIAPKPPGKRNDALQHYSEGCCWSRRHSKEGLEKAADCFRRTVELDPRYLEAYAALIDCYLRLTTDYFLPPDLREILAEGVAPLPLHEMESQPLMELRDRWNSATAERESQGAMDLNMQYPAVHQWRAGYLLAMRLYHNSLTNAKKRKSGLLDRQKVLRSVPNARIDPLNLNPAEEIQILCLLARNQIEAGNIEAAYLLLQRWYSIGEWPELTELAPHSSADLLLTAGRLAGWLASARQRPHGQRHAEELLNGAITLFEQLGMKRRASEARSELGRCYDREGFFDRARANFLAALAGLDPEDGQLKSRALLRLAFAEMKVGHLRESLERLNEASQLIGSASPFTANFYHIEMATTLGEYAIAEKSDRYFNQACQHYQKALGRSEALGHYRHTAVILNNHGYLLLEFMKLKEAQFALTGARKLFNHLGEQPPQLDDVLARFHLETQQFDLAEQAARRSVMALEACGEDAVLAESLRTQGRVLCKLRRHREARRVLDRAYEIAQRCGDYEGAGMALIIMVEEVQQISAEEKREISTSLVRLLQQSQRPSLIERLVKCLKLIAVPDHKRESQSDPNWQGATVPLLTELFPGTGHQN